MLNRSASLATSTSVIKASPGKLDIKRHSPCILYLSPFSLKKKAMTKSEFTLPTESLCCVLEQDTLSLNCLVLVQPRKTCSDRTLKLLTGMNVKHQNKQNLTLLSS